MALGAPEVITDRPPRPPRDYGGMGAALKADQPLANFPSRPAYPALRCHTELSRFSGARQGWLGGTRTAHRTGGMAAAG